MRNSIWSVNHVGTPSTISIDDKRLKAEKILSGFEKRFCEILRIVVANTDFEAKYEVSGKDPLVYLHTQRPNEFAFGAEIFAKVLDPRQRLKEKLRSELTFHCIFDEVIERYTKERRKPNPVLQEIKSSDFCYQLMVKFEAVPADKAKFPASHRLLREFQVLQHIWESYRSDLLSRKCTSDQLVGFPMPFEFKNVIGSPDYDFPKMTMDEFSYYNLHGKVEKMCQGPISSIGFGTDSKSVLSSLSYMSIEKVGPNVPYLMDLMQSQGERFSVSSALKMYDQLICRLMILHMYGVVHGDINPKCLNFGCREASNVLYINNFGSAVLGTLQSTPLHLFHDRFVSHIQVKDKLCHYLCDLESAFYIFIYMMLNRLPWDTRLPTRQVETSSDNPVQDAVTHKTTTADLKEKFWQSSNSFLWVTKSVAFEYQEQLYCNFTIDMLETIYSRMKESITTCASMSVTAFFKDIFNSGSAPYNCYFGIRKVIASYFRFESISQTLKDFICTNKLELLAKEDSTDKRTAWDLSFWCWNYLDADPDKRRR